MPEPRKRTMPLVPQLFENLKEGCSSCDPDTTTQLRFRPIIDALHFRNTLSEQQKLNLDRRASKLCRRVKSNELHQSSQFAWEVCSWNDVFDLILDDDWFQIDKRPYEYVEEDGNETKAVKMRIPDATFGLTTYNSDSVDLNRNFEAAGCLMDYSNKQPDNRLSQDRLRDMMYNPECGLVVDGAWGKIDIAFPFAVYEAKKQFENNDARQQIMHSCQIYLAMLDNLARNPSNVAEYQTIESVPCQMFAFTSRGPSWNVYMAYSCLNTCNVELIWHGSISDIHSASTLICIVDQVHNYAINHHRPFVLKHLDAWLAKNEQLGLHSAPCEPGDGLSQTQVELNRPTWWHLKENAREFRREKPRQTRQRNQDSQKPAGTRESETRQQAAQKTDRPLTGRVTKKASSKHTRHHKNSE